MDARSLTSPSSIQVIYTSVSTSLFPTPNDSSPTPQIPNIVSTPANDGSIMVTGSTSKHVAAGNIFGGVIGGLAIISCIILAVAFARRRVRLREPKMSKFPMEDSRFSQPARRGGRRDLFIQADHVIQHDRQGTRSDPQQYGETYINRPLCIYTSVGQNVFVAPFDHTKSLS